jgi:hypothetical protein
MSRSISARKLLVLLTGAILTTVTTAAQTTWYVDDNAPGDPGPGDPSVSDPLEDGSAENPFDAIQEGIDAAVDGDTVLVLDGTYTGDGNRDLDFGGRAITVRSENGPQTCIIDCEGSEDDPHRGFYFHSGESPASVVDGFCICNGYVGSYNPGGPDGGAIHCSVSSPTIISCVLAGNTAAVHGGGVYSVEGSPANIVDCVIAGNMADNGGGVLFSTPYGATITNCTIAGNLATRDSWHNLEGGGGVLGSGPLTLTNCLIVGNITYSRGGGICTWSDPGELTIAGCTISGNTAYDYYGEGDAGGGVRCAYATITGCILWDDWPQEVFTYDPGWVNLTYSDIERGWLGVGNIGVDPLFADPDGPDNNPATWWDNDYHLSAGSPCIDAGCNWSMPPDSTDLDADGDTSEITPLDLDGEGRFFDDPNTPDTGCGNPPIVDMGAYEFGDAGPQPCFGDLDDDRDVDLGDLALLLANYGDSQTCEGDLNCDGNVDLTDLAALLGVYGTTCD